MQKIVTVLGARPQFIKAAPVCKALSDVGGIESILIHTGQHYDKNMSDIFFTELGIPEPKYNLGIGGGSHGAMTGRQLENIENILLDEKPDSMIVYGDTNSTLAGALAAVKLHIPVAHVEAGLRSFNRRMPEEINRILTDQVSEWLFTPTEIATSHLRDEGFDPAKIYQVGDVMYDVAKMFGDIAVQKSTILDTLDLRDTAFCLATVHRQENTDDPSRLQAIFGALREMATRHPVVLPIHPRTHKELEKLGDVEALTQGLTVIEPVGFLDVISLLKSASLLMSDSGGMQKEAFFHETPVVILRDETEWRELLSTGWAKLVPPVSAQAISAEANALFNATGQKDIYPYGDGQSARRMIELMR